MKDILTTVNSLITLIAPILMGVAFAYFLYGVIVYIKAGSSETAKAKGKEILINGVIGLLVMVSVWGIVRVIQSTFLVGTNNTNIKVQIVK